MSNYKKIQEAIIKFQQNIIIDENKFFNSNNFVKSNKQNDALFSELYTINDILFGDIDDNTKQETTFKAIITLTNNCLNILSDKIMSGFDVNINITNRLLFATVISCIVNYPVMIKKMLSKIGNIKDVLQMNDTDGNNFFHYVFFNIKSLYEILEYGIPYNIIFVKNSDDISLVELLLYQNNLNLLIEDHIIDYNAINEYVNNSMNILHIAATFENNTCFQSLFDNKLISKVLLIKYDKNGNSPVMLLYKYNLSIFNNLITHEDFIFEYLGDQNKINSEYYKDNMNTILKVLIESNKMTTTLSKNNTLDLYNLFLNDIKLFEKFLESKCYDNNILLKKINDKCLFDIIVTNQVINDNLIKILESLFLENYELYYKILESNPKTASTYYYSEKIIDSIVKKDYLNFIERCASNYIEKKDDIYNIILTSLVNANSKNKKIYNIKLSKIQDLNLLTYLATTIPTIILNNTVQYENISVYDFLCYLLKYKNTMKDENIINIISKFINNKIITKPIINHNDYYVIKQSIMTSSDLTDILISNIDILLNETTIDKLYDKTILDYVILIQNNDIFKKLITSKIITSEVINYCNESQQHFTENIKSIDQLKLILENRSDFDTKYLYTKNILINLLKDGNNEILKLIISSNNFNETIFVLLYELILKRELKDANFIIMLMINHKFMKNKHMRKINKEGHNLINIAIKNKIIDLDKLLEHKYVNTKIFETIDKANNNILVNAVINNYGVDKICKSKFMSPKLYQEIFDINKFLIQYPNYDLLCHLIENNYIDKNSIQNIIINSNISDRCILGLAIIYADKKLLLELNKNNKNILKMVKDYSSIKYTSLKSIGIKIKDLLDNEGNAPIVNIAKTNKNMFIEILQENTLIYDILISKIDEEFLLNYGLKNIDDFIDYIPLEILDHKLLNVVHNAKPLIFSLKMTENLIKRFNFEIMNIKHNKTSVFHHIYTLDKNLIKHYLLYDQNNLCMFKDEMYDYILFEAPDILQLILENDNISLDNVLIFLKKILFVDNSKKYLDYFAVFAKSKYFNKNLLDYKIDEKNKTVFDCICDKYLFLDFILKNKIISSQMLLQKDENGELFIIKIKNKGIDSWHEIIKYIEKDKIKEKNNDGSTLLHILASDENFFKLYAEIKPSQEDEQIRDNYGKIYLDYLIELKNETSITYLLQNNFKIAEYQNVFKTNMFSLILDTFPHLDEHLQKYVTMDLLKNRDSYGMTTFDYIIKNSDTLLNHCIKKFNIEQLLDNYDIKGRTCLMIAAEHNIICLKILLNLNCIKEKHFYANKNSGSCLTRMITKNPQEIIILLNHKVLNMNILNLRQYDKYDGQIINMNIIQLASKYSPDALMLLLGSKYDFSHLIFEVVKKNDILLNSFKIAIIYQPECVKIFLNSKYDKKKMFIETNEISTTSCFMDALKMQPASYINLIASNEYTSKEFVHGGSNPSDYYKRLFNIDSDSDEENFETISPLLKFKDEQTDDELVQCTICSINKKKVIFNPCSHKFCVNCSIRLKKCPQCNGNIQDKLVYDQ